MGVIKVEAEVIPSSPEDLKKISDAIDEIVIAKTKEALYKQAVTDIINRLHDELKVSKLWIRNAGNDRYSGAFDEKIRSQDNYEIFFEKLEAVKNKKSDNSSNV
jgi:hypothetical protein